MRLTLLECVPFLSIIIKECLSVEILEGCDYNDLQRMYYCNDITHVFPNQFYGNYHLKCTDCNISRFTEKTFPYNNRLDSFNVSYSNIQTIYRRAFSKLTTIQYIYLDNNAINKIEADAFSGVKQLFELHLEHNNLKQLTPKFLNNAATNSLDLSYNQLKEIAEESFEGVGGVLVLDLSHNKIEKLHRRSFDSLNSLEILDLQNNQLCQLPLGVLSMLKELKSLNLSSNKLTSLSMGTLSGLKSLNTLNLENNSLSHFIGDFLLPLTSLENLDISLNGIYHFDGNAITENSSTLKSLRIDYNIFQCHNLRDLVRYFRKVNIDIISLSESYDVQNIFGIACTETDIRMTIPYKKFFALAKEETEEIKEIC
ncbi:hypothetical protein WA026_006310 [Henosepilachna vigintioctopunctata]|uniref:Uncharacterized protein n=1 Tax=Henosepilachna vigintioctopunctata TaxID=420089 RepID=A0AAW1TR27_9CUCU